MGFWNLLNFYLVRGNGVIAATRAFFIGATFDLPSTIFCFCNTCLFVTFRTYFGVAGPNIILLYNGMASKSIRYSFFSKSSYFSTIGKHVSRLRPGAILGRVTGLDPAGAHYNYVGAADRLDSTDATFVDVMYTDSIVTSIFIIVGHVSYYPNGGVAPQNGCVVGKLRSKTIFRKVYSFYKKCDKFIPHVCKPTNVIARGNFQLSARTTEPPTTSSSPSTATILVQESVQISPALAWDYASSTEES